MKTVRHCKIGNAWFLSLLLSVQIFALEAGAVRSFYEFTPTPSIIDGNSYPRNGMTLFRGTSDQQMNLNKALRAMLGDPSIYIESLFFSTIKNRLMQESFHHAIPLSSYLESRIESLLKLKGRALTEYEAATETQKLVDGTFDHLSSQNILISQYIDYQSSTYNDWPQDAVFTTIVSPVAATYGNRMLVLKENQYRSLDLNYWNKIHRGLWSVYTRDTGEFIAFGYMKPDDLVGYQLRIGPEKSWHSIDLAFYKVIHQNKPAVLVFSGKGQNGAPISCLDFNEDQSVIYKCDYNRGQVVLRPPRLTSERPALVGVIVLCDSQGRCDPVPKNEIQKYPIAPLDSQSSQLQGLSSKIQNKTIRFIPVGR